MADEGPDRYALGRLVHDYLKILMWPLVVLIVVILYQDDVIEILQSREVKLGGVFEVGQQVTQIKEQTGQEIADVRALLQTLREASGAEEKEEVAADIEAKLANVDRNLTREVTQIQQTQPVRPQARSGPSMAPPTQSASGASDADKRRAADWERRGFVALLDRDIDTAREAFANAADAWPVYHNVVEISELLDANARALADPRSDEWQRVYRTILADYSWGMPSDLRPAFRNRAVEAYGVSR